GLGTPFPLARAAWRLAAGLLALVTSLTTLRLVAVFFASFFVALAAFCLLRVAIGRSPSMSGACAFYFLRIALCGLRLPMRPLSVPAAGSIAALISVGLPESSAVSTARLSSSGVVTWT